LWRAYSQLKIKVRALPTWRNPVGDGAKRTRGDDLEDSGIRSEDVSYGREKSIVKPGKKSDFPEDR